VKSVQRSRRRRRRRRRCRPTPAAGLSVADELTDGRSPDRPPVASSGAARRLSRG